MKFLILLFGKKKPFESDNFGKRGNGPKCLRTTIEKSISSGTTHYVTKKKNSGSFVHETQ